MNTTAMTRNTSTLRQDLHDLAQPLTRLQWRLELGQHSNDSNDLRETIHGALADSLELMEWIRRIRATIEAETLEPQGRAA
jgi:hypothetical protein